jgi:hypothetical protein
MERSSIAVPLVMPIGQGRLGVADRIAVVAEVIATYCAARWWLFRMPFPAAVAAARTSRAGRSGPPVTENDARTAGLRLGRVVERTLRALPVDSRCLITALVLTRMLTRRGLESTFVLGVRAQPHFAAHAWVERDGVPLLPTTADFHRLTEL